MRSATTAAKVVFYGGLALVLVAIFLQVIGDILPDGLARSVSINSEGYLLALLLAAWIQFVRPRLADTRQEWPVTLGVGLLYGGITAALLASDLPSRFRTLNEAFLAAAFAVVYLQLRRPLPRWVPFVLAAALLAVLVVLGRTTVVTDLAETLGFLLLLPLAVDVFDRRILDPEARTSPALAYAFYVFLAVLIVGLTLSERVQLGGDFGEVVAYVHRMQEAFICLLLMGVYFGVLRALRGSHPDLPGHPVQREAVRG